MSKKDVAALAAEVRALRDEIARLSSEVCRLRSERSINLGEVRSRRFTPMPSPIIVPIIVPMMPLQPYTITC